MMMIQRRSRALLVLIALAAFAALFTGCKADSAVQRSSDIDFNAEAQQARLRSASRPLTRDEAIDQNDGRPVLVCFGDSLTAGYGIDTTESYPAVLQRNLDAAGYRYRVVNLGISGDTTKDGLARIDRVMALSPALVVLEFGGNDGLRGLPVSTTRENLDAMMARLVPTRTQIALAGITLPPEYGNAYVKDFDATYRMLSAKYHLPLLPFLLKDVYGVPGSLQQDGIHPTAKGAQQVAKNVMALIQPMLVK